MIREFETKQERQENITEEDSTLHRYLTRSMKKTFQASKDKFWRDFEQENVHVFKRVDL